MAHMMTRKQAAVLRESGFDPNFTLKIERNAHLNHHLLPKLPKLSSRRQSAPDPKVTPKKSVLKKRRMTTSTPLRRVTFNEVVTVTTVGLTGLSPVGPINVNIGNVVPSDENQTESAATGSEIMVPEPMVCGASTSSALNIGNALIVSSDENQTESAATATGSEIMVPEPMVNDNSSTVTNGTVQPSDSMTGSSSMKPAE